jgi:hypothetical protein
MTGMPGRSGRKTFVPTPEQRQKVKALAGSGMPQEQICQLVINPQTDKPLDEKSLRTHFKREIATGEIELHALIDNFMITTILGVAPPAGARAIGNQHARGALDLFRQDPDGPERVGGEPPQGSRRRCDRRSG